MDTEEILSLKAVAGWQKNSMGWKELSAKYLQHWKQKNMNYKFQCLPFMKLKHFHK